jgi:hypothetical protein
MFFQADHNGLGFTNQKPTRNPEEFDHFDNDWVDWVIDWVSNYDPQAEMRMPMNPYQEPGRRSQVAESRCEGLALIPSIPVGNINQ